MTLKHRKVERALMKKGFEREFRDHVYFVYYSLSGKRTRIRTSISHGLKSRDIGDQLASLIARQCKLSLKQFKALIDCSLTQPEYEEIVKSSHKDQFHN